MFANAMQGLTYTENGMPTNSSSGNAILDMFFKMAASRQRGTINRPLAEGLFENAYMEDRQLALRCLFFLRNIRGGQGERQLFRIAYAWLIHEDPRIAERYLKLIPVFGRWDDLLFLVYNTPLQGKGFDMFWRAVQSGETLAAKWAPRENKSHGMIAKALIKHLAITPKHYRKIISEYSNTVETVMCDSAWQSIHYSDVPSRAMSIYDEAFFRHDPERFLEYLKSGKVHAKSIFPHEVLKPLFNRKVSPIRNLRIENQWSNLPNYVPQGRRMLPVIDVSSSMSGEPMLIAIALGLYVAERNIGLFQDCFFTFSEEPEFVKLESKELLARVRQIQNSDWGGSTDLEAVFSMILSKADDAELPQAEMPTHILIISDMQFNQATNISDKALSMIARKYEQSGYIRPNIIFWNVRDSNGVPAKTDSRGVALVSGFSPSVIGSVFNVPVSENEPLTPMQVMLNTLNNEPYDRIIV